MAASTSRLRVRMPVPTGITPLNESHDDYSVNAYPLSCLELAVFLSRCGPGGETNVIFETGDQRYTVGRLDSLCIRLGEGQ